MDLANLENLTLALEAGKNTAPLTVNSVGEATRKKGVSNLNTKIILKYKSKSEKKNIDAY